MLSKNPEPSFDVSVHDVAGAGPGRPAPSTSRPHGERRSIQHDVERLIDIAAQLFEAIERQIRHIEEDLNFSEGTTPARKGQIVFKEQLIRSALSLERTLEQIAQHLGEGVLASGSPSSPRVESYWE